MSRPFHTTKFRIQPVRHWLAGCFVFWGVGMAVADVTLEINVGPVDAPADTVAILVADRDGNGFTEMRGVHGMGTRLSVGETFGNPDDIIVAVIQADSGLHWGGESGFGDIASEIDYEALGLEEGDELNLYWFDEHLQPGAVLEHGDNFRSFRSDSASDSGGSIGFVLPPDGEVCSIAHLSSELGGDSDPMRSGGGREVRIGQVGSMVHDLNSGGPLSRLLAPNEVERFFINVQSPGGLKITTRGMEGLIAKLYRRNGTEMPSTTRSMGEMTELVGGVTPGLYFISIEGESRSVAGVYEIEADTGKLRPDLAIQKPGSRSYLGAKRYNLSGAGQSVVAKTNRGRKIGLGVEGTNRGRFADSFTFTGSRSNRSFVVRFFRVKPGRKNVTSAMRRGFDVPGVTPNEKVSLIMEIDPKGNSKSRGAARKFKGSVLLKSSNLATLKDRVKATLINQ